MRSVLVIIGVAMLLLGTADEQLHHHDLGETDGHCVACQVDRTPGAPIALPAPLTATVAVDAPYLEATPSASPPRHPLGRAPKTSPPGLPLG